MTLRKYTVGFLLVLAALAGARGSIAQVKDAQVKRALVKLDLDNPRGAADDLRKILAQSPKNAEAHAALALALLELGDKTQAATEAQAAFDIDRKVVLARIARANVYGKEGRVQDALKEFDQALKLDQKEIGTYLALSRYYIGLDSLKPAEIKLYQAQQVNDKDVRAYLGLAELYEKQRIPDLAITQYESAKQLDPSDVTVMAKLGALYYRTRKYNESVGEWIKILKIDSTYSDAYYQIGQLYYLGDQFANAVGFAEKYVALEPDDVKGHWLLARALTEAGLFARALPALEKVSSNDSLRALSQLLLAKSYFYSNEPAKAIAIYRGAKSLVPIDLDNFGRALINSGDTLGGIEKLRASLVGDSIRTEKSKMNTRQVIAQQLFAMKKYDDAALAYSEIAQASNAADQWNMVGYIYNVSGQGDRAIEAYNKALAVDPANLSALMGKGTVYMTKDPASAEMKESFEGLLGAATAAGNNEMAGQANMYLGYHLMMKKEFKKSIEALEKSLTQLDQKGKPHQNALLMTAQAYHSDSNFKKAKEYYKKYLDRDPTNATAKDALKQLEKF